MEKRIKAAIIISFIITVVNVYLLLFTYAFIILWSEDLDNWVLSVSWSPDGKLLAAGTYRKFVVFNEDGSKLWESGKLNGRIDIISWSPDGKLLAAESDESIVVFNRDGYRLWTHYLGGEVHGISWSPDGKLLAAKTYGKFAVFDRTGNLLWKVDKETLYELFYSQTNRIDIKHIDVKIKNYSWNSDGSKIAIAIGGNIRKIIVFSKNGDLLWSKNQNKTISTISWSPNNKLLAAGGDFRKVIVYNENGTKLWESKDLGYRINGIYWFPDSKKLVVKSSWKDGSDKYHSKIILLNSNGSILWESNDIKELIYSIALNEDNQLILATDNKIIAFDTDNGKELWRKIILMIGLLPGTKILDIDASPSSNKIALGTYPKVIVFGLYTNTSIFYIVTFIPIIIIGMIFYTSRGRLIIDNVEGEIIRGIGGTLRIRIRNPGRLRWKGVVKVKIGDVEVYKSEVSLKDGETKDLKVRIKWNNKFEK
ncbi:MAG: PQQ-binding-like beta-propeller repeat protein [Desulfurococcales archaeon]|nr:PQQ-binding-like beta-propeller repeat protein [Desulfurococcales archaeon]